MTDIRYSNAMAEVLHYLKGIRREDIEKIPEKLINFFEENQSKDFECKFDYKKPLKELELDLQDETKGLIAMICLNYWCETDQQKNMLIDMLNKNEQKYQSMLREKYIPDNIFKNKTNTLNLQYANVHEIALLEYKENFFAKLKKFILKLLHIKS